jgi:hypothetical protein
MRLDARLAVDSDGDARRDQLLLLDRESPPLMSHWKNGPKARPMSGARLLSRSMGQGRVSV